MGDLIHLMESNDPLNLVFHSLGVLKQHFDDAAVQEVMINGPDQVFIERHGRMQKIDVALSADQIISAIVVLATREGKGMTASDDQILDVRWPGARICAVVPPISLNGPTMSIRKHSRSTIRLEDYIKNDAMPAEALSTLQDLVKRRESILVVGGTSSGKTTLMKALLLAIDDEDRVVTIEDMPELDLARHKPNVVSFETRKDANIGYTRLVATALRYAPTRIILGEVRDGAAMDLLSAANTGHEGCMATIHANSSFEGLTRFEYLVMQSGTRIPLSSIQQSIATSFKHVVFMAKVGGKRRLIEILRINGYDREKKEYDVEYLYNWEKSNAVATAVN